MNYQYERETGFSVMEVLVASAVMSIILLGVGKALTEISWLQQQIFLITMGSIEKLNCYEQEL